MNSVSDSPMGWRWHARGGAALKTPMVFNVPPKQEEEECQSSFKVGMNEMPVRPIHNGMSIGHAPSGAGLPTPLGVYTIVTK